MHWLHSLARTQYTAPVSAPQQKEKHALYEQSTVPTLSGKQTIRLNDSPDYHAVFSQKVGHTDYRMAFNIETRYMRFIPPLSMCSDLALTGFLVCFLRAHICSIPSFLSAAPLPLCSFLNTCLLHDWPFMLIGWLGPWVL